MSSTYTISINMFFQDDSDISDMEKLIGEKCQSLFDTFENINLKITKDTEQIEEGFIKTSTETITKDINTNQSAQEFYDF